MIEVVLEQKIDVVKEEGTRAEEIELVRQKVT